MRMILGVMIVCLSGSLAFANCESVVRGERGAEVWQCDPPSAPAKCQHISGILLCSGRIDQGDKPSNCRFNKVGKYVCWDE